MIKNQKQYDDEILDKARALEILNKLKDFETVSMIMVRGSTSEISLHRESSPKNEPDRINGEIYRLVQTAMDRYRLSLRQYGGIVEEEQPEQNEYGT